MNARLGRWSAVLLLGALLSLFCTLPGFAAGSVGQVNLQIGQTPDTVYLTYSAPDAAQGAVSLTGPGRTAAYTAAPAWSDSAGKYLYSARLDGLVPGSSYAYEIAGATSGAFQLPVDSGARTPAGSGIGTYADWRQAGAWCRESLSWTVETGLLRGKAGNRLAPSDTVTQTEGAAFLQRLIWQGSAA